MAMANLGTYGGSLQNLILMRTDRSADTLVAVLGSCSPHISLQQVSRSMGGFEPEGSCGGQKRGPYSYAGPYGDGGAEEPGSGEDGDELGGDEFAQLGGHVEKKRRLSFEQVRALERNFEVENKLEPERKMQLAKELGLQPRQVAVWFQNRRARWKIKQLERDFEVLTHDYHRLQADLDAITRDKDSLRAQVNRLRGFPTTGDDAEPVESEQCRSDDHPASPEPSDRSDIDDPARTSPSPAADNPADFGPAAAAAPSAGPVKRTASSDSINSGGLTDSPCSSDMSRVEVQQRAVDSGCCRPSNNTISPSPVGEWAQFAPESFMGPDLMVPEPLADEQLSSDVASFHAQRGAGPVKAEDTMDHAFLLSRLDDEPVLPNWWDWA